jgi:hypothetical protein
MSPAVAHVQPPTFEQPAEVAIGRRSRHRCVGTGEVRVVTATFGVN